MSRKSKPPPAPPPPLDLNTVPVIGLGLSQYDLAKLRATRTVEAIVKEWYAGGIRVLRTNHLWTDYQLEHEFLTACKKVGMAVIWAGFDYRNEGIEAGIPNEWWSKLSVAFDPLWKAQQIALQVIKGCSLSLTPITDEIEAFKARNAANLSNIWMSPADDCEDGIRYVFRSMVLKPDGTFYIDSSTYAGWSQITKALDSQREGNGDPWESRTRKLIESCVGPMPTDADFTANTLAAEVTLKAVWGGKWLEGAHHGYWKLTKTGLPYYGQCGLGTGRFIAEYGIDLAELPGRYDLIGMTPHGAESVVHWPEKKLGDPPTLWQDAQYQQIIKDSAVAV